MTFTNEQIEAAKAAAARHKGNFYDGQHEHPDCILIACAWLSAQTRTKHPSTRGWSRPLKHIIESWGGRYISTDDVVVAAELVGLSGTYPRFNISSRLTRPSESRLEGIGEAMKHPNYRVAYDDRETYARFED